MRKERGVLMDHLSYNLLSKRDIKGKDYVEVSLGKQRKKKFRDTSVFYEKDVFSLFDATLWDHYREYNRKGVNKLSKRECERITDGLDQVMQEIQACQTPKELKQAFGIRHHKSLPDYEDFDIFKKQVYNLFKEFKEWLETNSKTEDYITICT